MARLSRWVVPGLAHHVMLSGHNGLHVLADAADRALLLDSLWPAARVQGVAVHGYALLDDAAHLMLRPTSTRALGAMVQAMGRRFVAAYNARHQRTGTPWNGRFRAAPLEPGETTLSALLWLEMASRHGHAPGEPLARWSNVTAQHLTDPPELWAMGNTPFERERLYAERIDAGLPPGFEGQLMSAVRKGVPFGRPGFIVQMEAKCERRATSRPRGRPTRGIPVQSNP